MSEKIYTIEEIKNILKEILQNELVYEAILFGSYAKQEATTKSDVDILIDSKGEIKGLKFYALIDIIKEKLDKNVDVIEKSELDEKSMLQKEIERTGIIVYRK